MSMLVSMALCSQCSGAAHHSPCKARDVLDNHEVALKLEHHSIDPSMLADEYDTYKALPEGPGFPRVYWYGYHDDYRVMAMELLGPTLQDLVTFCGGRFSLKTTLLIADQMLHRLEALHASGIVHRDVKPSNMLLGGEVYNNNLIYLADYGITLDLTLRGDHTDQSDEPIASWLVGSAMFASIRGHCGPSRTTPTTLFHLMC